ncbi:MAG: Fe-S cluster assembly protein SufB, partial [Cyanobacteria bacterium P01_F01_bin.53]
MTSSVQSVVSQPYKYGFVTDIEADALPRGLSEEIVRAISAKKNEPEFMLEFRLKAYRRWLTMTEPSWPNVGYPPIDYNDIVYYSAPKQEKKKLDSLDDVDPALLDTFDKLGISITEQKRLANVAVDVIFDSVSIATTFKEDLAKHGIIFCSISEAIQDHPDLIKKYLGTVIPTGDNYFAALNSAVFSDGSFVYIPKGVKCPMDLQPRRDPRGRAGDVQRAAV